MTMRRSSSSKMLASKTRLTGNNATVMKDLTLQDLMNTVGVTGLGEKSETTGNMLVKYGESRQLSTPKENGVHQWSVDIEVPIADDDGIPY